MSKFLKNLDRQRQLKRINHSEMCIERWRKRLIIKNDYKIITNEISKLKESIKDLEIKRDSILNKLRNT